MTAEFPRLLTQAQNGNERAFATLWKRTNPRLTRFVRAFLDIESTQDVVSETWIDIARNLGGFAGDEDAFVGWAFTIARRRLIDRSRRAAAERRRFEAARMQTSTEASTSNDPAQVMLEHVSAEQAIAFVTEHLPNAQAEVVILRVIGGLDIHQVAAITGQKPGTVRVLQHRALKRLSDAFVRREQGEVEVTEQNQENSPNL